jgi:hypothetical protein
MVSTIVQPLHRTTSRPDSAPSGIDSALAQSVARLPWRAVPKATRTTQSWTSMIGVSEIIW